MKKALSILLAVLVLFSMTTMVGAAEETPEVTVPDGQVRVVFLVDGKEYYAINVLPGVNFVDRLQTGKTPLKAPVKDATETTEYTFVYWEKATKDENGELVPTGITANTGNIPAVGADEKEVYYIAIFAEEDIVANQSLWAFVRSLFERINMIFEYIAKVFEGVIEF